MLQGWTQQRCKPWGFMSVSTSLRWVLWGTVKDVLDSWCVAPMHISDAAACCWHWKTEQVTSLSTPVLNGWAMSHSTLCKLGWPWHLLSTSSVSSASTYLVSICPDCTWAHLDTDLEGGLSTIIRLCWPVHQLPLHHMLASQLCASTLQLLHD